MGAMKPLLLLLVLAAVALASQVGYCRVYTYVSNGVIDCSGNCYAYGPTGKYIKSGGLRESCESNRRKVNCDLFDGCVCCIST